MQHWDKDRHKQQIGWRGVSFYRLRTSTLPIRESAQRWVGTFDLVESLRYESLDGFKTLHHKAQSGKLTAAVRDQLIRQRRREDLLQAKRLEPSEGRTWRRWGRDGISSIRGILWDEHSQCCCIIVTWLLTVKHYRFSRFGIRDSLLLVLECYITYSQVQLLTDVDCVADVSVWLRQGLTSSTDGVGSDLRKLCPKHLYIGLHYKAKRERKHTDSLLSEAICGQTFTNM